MATTSSASGSPPIDPGSAPPATPRRGVAQLWPSAYPGGAERAMLTLRQATDGKLPWRGIAVLGRGPMDPNVLAEARRFGPVAEGERSSQELLRSCAVVVANFVGQARSICGPGPALVQISHCPDAAAWVRATLLDDGVDQYVGVSRSALGPIPEARRGGAVVVPNALDASRLGPGSGRDAIRDAWSVPRRAKVLGFYGRFAEEKNPQALAAALRYLPPEWVGVAVGQGPISPGGSGTRVRVVPSDPHAGSVLRGFDALLVPSRFESFGLSAAEALACEVPVVMTPTGLAADHPRLVRMLPEDPSGEQIARAVAADQVDIEGTARRVKLAARYSRWAWSEQRLSDSWVKLVKRTARLRNPHHARLVRVEECGHRTAHGCGCQAGEARCGLRRGSHAEGSIATLHDCLQCSETA